jgi:flagellar FliL protein
MSTKADTEAAAPKKKSKKMLIIIVAAVVLLGGGGAGAYFAFFSGPSKPKPPVPGKVVPLEAVTMNLAEGHFLKLKLSLQTTAKAAEAPDGSKAMDIAIDQFSNRTVAELASNAARDQAKAELRKRVNEAYEGDVMDVYFTEFVMQ